MAFFKTDLVIVFSSDDIRILKMRLHDIDENGRQVVGKLEGSALERQFRGMGGFGPHLDKELRDVITAAEKIKADKKMPIDDFQNVFQYLVYLFNVCAEIGNQLRDYFQLGQGKDARLDPDHTSIINAFKSFFQAVFRLDDFVTELINKVLEKEVRFLKEANPSLKKLREFRPVFEAEAR